MGAQRVDRGATSRGHGQPGGQRPRLAGLAVAAIIFAGACTGAAPTPQLTMSPAPPPTLGSPTPFATPTPTAAPPTASPSLAPTESPSSWASLPANVTSNGYFDVVVGPTPMATAAGDHGAAAASELNDFGFDLLRALEPDGNLCASPTSIALALAMARAGARGQTATEMDAVLHGFGADGDAAEIAALLESLGSVAAPPVDASDPQLNVVSQAFLQEGMPFEPAYLDRLGSYFGAGLGFLNFASDPDAARAVINRWVSDQTKARIPQVLQPGDLTSDTRFALANAVYLKAQWDRPFDPIMTDTLAFTTASGLHVKVPTMQGGGYLYYVAGKGYRAVDLPYASANLAMTIVVPDDMTAFTRSLSAAELSAIERAEKLYEVELTLPRFSIDSRFELADVLAALGMPTAFSSLADFSAMTTADSLSLSHVIHQANIDVDESGTTAAAVTVITGSSSAGPGGPPVAVFHVDRPFLYFIRDTESGAVLFMGRVDDPGAK